MFILLNYNHIHSYFYLKLVVFSLHVRAGLFVCIAVAADLLLCCCCCCCCILDLRTLFVILLRVTRYFGYYHRSFLIYRGWGKIDFTWSIRNWVKYQNLYHVIDISCNTCEKHPTVDLFSLDYGYRPFIVVNTTSSQTIKRQRRSINCSPGVSECCRDKLYISFAEIGWNDWILHPAGYDAYFCRGSCASVATITSTYHLFVRVSLKRLHFSLLSFFDLMLCVDHFYGAQKHTQTHTHTHTH